MIIFAVSYIYLSTYLTSVNWEQICSLIHVNFAWDTPSFFFPFLVSIHNSTSLLPSQKDKSTCPSPPKHCWGQMTLLLPTVTQAPWFCNSNSPRPSPLKPLCGCCFPYSFYSLRHLLQSQCLPRQYLD